MLRVAVAVIGALLFVAGAVLALRVSVAGLELAAAGAVILLGTLFEARRYRARISSPTGWQDTDERFVDPTTGHLMQVRFNPGTGERDYVDLGPGKP